MDPEGVSDPAALELIEAEKGWWIAAGDSGGYTFLPNGAKYKILRSRVTEDDIKNGASLGFFSSATLVRRRSHHRHMCFPDPSVVAFSVACFFFVMY